MKTYSNGNPVLMAEFDKEVERMINNNKDKPYLLHFKNYMLQKENSYTTIRLYITYVIAFMEHVNKDISELNYDDYSAYLAGLAHGISHKKQNYFALKSFSKFLYKSNRNSNDPMSNIDIPKGKESIGTKTKRANSFLSKDEMGVFLNSVYTGVGSNRAKIFQEKMKERDIALIQLFLNTGLRCSAVHSLNIDSVDWNRGLLYTTEKGGAPRTVMLSKSVLNDLKAWKVKREQYLGDTKEDALFISSRKKRLANRSIHDLVNKYGIDIKNKNLSPHKLRATFATQVYGATSNLYLTQQAMGHFSPTMTELYIRGMESKSSEQASAVMEDLTYKK